MHLNLIFKNYKKIIKNHSSQKNIIIINKGVSSLTKEAGFTFNNNMEGKITTKSKNKINLITLNNYFKKINPTFIKIDIEGHEKSAIKGMGNIIRKGVTKFAICVYHNPNDIYEIAKMILSYNKNYKFFLRHYSTSITDTVIYVIPKKDN